MREMPRSSLITCSGYSTKITTDLLNSRLRIINSLSNSSNPEQEFLIATDMTTGGTLEERLRWAFKMYDEDGSG